MRWSDGGLVAEHLSRSLFFYSRSVGYSSGGGASGKKQPQFAHGGTGTCTENKITGQQYLLCETGEAQAKTKNVTIQKSLLETETTQVTINLRSLS